MGTRKKLNNAAILSPIVYPVRSLSQQALPFFVQPDGVLTAGNSSQLSDGAAALILASSSAIERYGLKIPFICLAIGNLSR
jgi:hypothetical protein